MVALGCDAKREVEDMHLSRYACYLVVQNADPSKEVVALGQTYFAVKPPELGLSPASSTNSTHTLFMPSFARIEADVRARIARDHCCTLATLDTQEYVRSRAFSIQVNDTGIGFSEEQRPHLFERFYRSENVHGRFNGNGLGLSIVEAILEHYGGTITAVSQGCGQGASVTAIIPFVESSTARRPPLLRRQLAPDGSSH